ncbi:hypothetical protein [Tsuneonella suprasediminis]|uniref:hypothetical protein n=1 Tax=Tsuneonella suprasediminis TaxID=2306996 RepID=UPI002F938A9B
MARGKYDARNLAHPVSNMDRSQGAIDQLPVPAPCGVVARSGYGLLRCARNDETL